MTSMQKLRKSSVQRQSKLGEKNERKERKGLEEALNKRMKLVTNRHSHSQAHFLMIKHTVGTIHEGSFPAPSPLEIPRSVPSILNTNNVAVRILLVPRPSCTGTSPHTMTSRHAMRRINQSPKCVLPMMMMVSASTSPVSIFIPRCALVTVSVLVLVLVPVPVPPADIRVYTLAFRSSPHPAQEPPAAPTGSRRTASGAWNTRHRRARS